MKLIERLRELEDEVYELQLRWYFLKRFQEQLRAQAVGGMVRPSNDMAYSLVFDVYEMFVVNLGSFSKGALSSGGFLDSLKGHLDELKQRKLKPSKEYDDVRRYDQKNIDEAFSRLFPAATSRQPQQADIDRLKEAWDSASRRVIELRNDVHAHRYEPKQKKLRKKGQQPPLLSMKEARDLFDHFERWLNDLRLLCDNSSFGYYANNNEAGAVAEDLVDIVLHGSINGFDWKMRRIEGKDDAPSYWKRREDFYTSQEWADERSEWPFNRST